MVTNTRVSILMVSLKAKGGTIGKTEVSTKGSSRMGIERVVGYCTRRIS